jgi:CDP-diacylglycerol--serine O-phosphatidyltransferase
MLRERFLLGFRGMADYPGAKPGMRGVIRRRGIYLLPNLFTTAALFSGFFAIVQAMNEVWDQASIAIGVAMVLDFLDGRVARLTRTQSEFGAEYDSLSDMVSFGAAPALIMYEWALRPLGRWGWIAAFIYCAGAGLRLARFNTNLDIVDKRYFQGLPSPAAAAVVVFFVWILNDFGIDRGDWLRWTAFALTVFAGVTMVTSIPFYSFKDLNFRRSVPFWATLLVVVTMLVISIKPALVLFGLVVVYALSGYVLWLWKFRRRRRSPF